MRRNGHNTDPGEYARRQAEESELSDAQSMNQRAAQAHHDGPIVNLHGEAGPELYDRLTNPDLESEEYRDLDDLLKPYLSQTQMLAAHGDDYYDDLSHELLNENLAERIITSRRRGRFLTGPFLEVAQAVEHDGGPLRQPFSEPQREAVREAVTGVRTDRQSLGDETFFKGVTEMHVSSEVHRDGGPEGSGGGLLSSLKFWGN